MTVSCVFCRIVARELPAEVVCEKPSWVAFRDINPQAPVHVLVVPKAHIPRLTGRYSNGDVKFEYLGETILRVVADVAESLGLSDYRIVINNGPGGGQEVDHLHAHILGGWPHGAPPLTI